MSYAVRAWRDSRGDTGITIGAVTPAGWDNHVVEIMLDEAEVPVFLRHCAEALERARLMSGPAQEEPMPGAYEPWTAETAAQP